MSLTVAYLALLFAAGWIVLRERTLRRERRERASLEAGLRLAFEVYVDDPEDRPPTDPPRRRRHLLLCPVFLAAVVSARLRDVRTVATAGIGVAAASLVTLVVLAPSLPVARPPARPAPIEAVPTPALPHPGESAVPTPVAEVDSPRPSPATRPERKAPRDRSRPRVDVPVKEEKPVDVEPVPTPDDPEPTPGPPPGGDAELPLPETPLPKPAPQPEQDCTVEIDELLCVVVELPSPDRHRSPFATSVKA